VSEQPKLLVIELDELTSIPKVIFKGEEVTSKTRIDFSWITKSDVTQLCESPYIRIESLEGIGTSNPALKVQGYNEPIQEDHKTALMLAVVGLNKALELHQSMNAAANEDPFKDAGDIWGMGDSLTTEEAANNVMKANNVANNEDETKDDSYTGDKDA
jgi:hypothetical protein